LIPLLCQSGESDYFLLYATEEGELFVRLDSESEKTLQFDTRLF